jgi:diacylglycerol kinase family enzyme
LRNKLAFAWAGFLNVGKRLPASCVVRLHQNGTVKEIKVGAARTLVLLNISYYAAGLLRADHTRPDDAELTVMVLPRFWHYLVLLATRSLPFTQRLFRRRVLPSWKASRVEVLWEHTNALQVDGESRSELLEGQVLDIQHAGRIKLLAGAAATGEA